MILVKSTSNSAGKYLVSREWGSWAPKAFQGIFAGNLSFWWNSDLFIPLRFGNWRFGSKVIQYLDIFNLRVHAMLV